ncbi:hypothetical protein DIPPA_16824 [Diplonema papillatum]|nr:hypothetical protein DIPPA_16824 [Diplonema papillatum]
MPRPAAADGTTAQPEKPAAAPPPPPPLHPYLSRAASPGSSAYTPCAAAQRGGAQPQGPGQVRTGTRSPGSLRASPPLPGITALCLANQKRGSAPDPCEQLSEADQIREHVDLLKSSADALAFKQRLPGPGGPRAGNPLAKMLLAKVGCVADPRSNHRRLVATDYSLQTAPRDFQYADEPA